MTAADLPFLSTYANGMFANPSDDILNPKQVGTPDWFRRKGEWLLHEYVNDRTLIPYSKRWEVAEARAYGNGTYANAKYLDQCCPLNPRTRKRKSQWNISWDNYKVYTKLRNKILGMFLDFDYFPTAQALDEGSTAIREYEMMQSLVAAKEQEFVQYYQQITGVQDLNQLPFQPQSIQELHAWQRMGAFKQPIEVAMERLIHLSMIMCQWDPNVKKMLLEDLVDVGYACAKDYNDLQNMRPKAKYVDIQYAVVRRTRRNDFEDISEAGEFKWYTLAELKGMGLSDVELNEIAQKIQTLPYNMNYRYTYNNPSYLNNNLFDYDRFGWMKACVFEYEFQSIMSETYTVRTGTDGAKRAYLEPDGKVRPEKQNRKSVNDNEIQWYKCCMVVGTKTIFDYGFKNNVPLSIDDIPLSSYSFHKWGDVGITQMAIPIIDEIELTIRRLRFAMTKAKPDGIAVEQTALANIVLNGQKQDPLDLLRMYYDGGSMLWRHPVDKRGQPLQGIQPPIVPLPGGVGKAYTELTSVFFFHLQQLRDIIGLAPGTDASAPGPEQAVGITQIAEEATQHVLKPMIFAYKGIKRAICNKLAFRWQIMAAYAPEEFAKMASLIGELSVAAIVSNNISDWPRLGIEFEMIVDTRKREEIQGALMQAMAGGKNGNAQLNMRDYFFVTNCLDTGNFKFAQAYLAYREEEELGRQALMQQANMQENGKNLMAAEQAKADTEAQRIVMQEDEKRKTIKMQEEEKRKTLVLEYQLKGQLEQQKPQATATTTT